MMMMAVINSMNRDARMRALDTGTRLLSERNLTPDKRVAKWQLRCATWIFLCGELGQYCDVYAHLLPWRIMVFIAVIDLVVIELSLHCCCIVITLLLHFYWIVIMLLLFHYKLPPTIDLSCCQYPAYDAINNSATSENGVDRRNNSQTRNKIDPTDFTAFAHLSHR